jgi:CO dehydrogenase maturation factor
MKIAFVGKGGSGKSTISSLFIRHLAEQKQHVIAVDADINQNLAGLIEADFETGKALSLEDNKSFIRNILVGSNAHIDSAKAMIKTTPPGNGSHTVKFLEGDPIIKQFATSFSPSAYFMHVGTYEDDGIGISCYHTSLSIFENILSHTSAAAPDEWVVADMVAGTDAFSGPLHAMFDVMFVVVEPSVESIGVFNQFLKLATAAGVEGRVRLIANKVEDDEDTAYIAEQTGYAPTVVFSYDPSARKQRQRGELVVITDDWRERLDQIVAEARRYRLSPNDHLKILHDLHRTFASQKFTIKKYGDTLGQIDSLFSFKKTGVSDHA